MLNLKVKFFGTCTFQCICFKCYTLRFNVVFLFFLFFVFFSGVEFPLNAKKNSNCCFCFPASLPQQRCYSPCLSFLWQKPGLDSAGPTFCREYRIPKPLVKFVNLCLLEISLVKRGWRARKEHTPMLQIFFSIYFKLPQTSFNSLKKHSL